MTVSDAAPTRTLDLLTAASGLGELWSPRVAARVNDVVIKVARIQGDFVWHNHPDTDEAFLCLDGRLTIELRDGDGAPERTITLDRGQLAVVPRGVFHCPHSADGASIALFEAAGTVNTGAVRGALTAPVDLPLD